MSYSCAREKNNLECEERLHIVLRSQCLISTQVSKGNWLFWERMVLVVGSRMCVYDTAGSSSLWVCRCLGELLEDSRNAIITATLPVNENDFRFQLVIIPFNAASRKVLK